MDTYAQLSEIKMAEIAPGSFYCFKIEKCKTKEVSGYELDRSMLNKLRRYELIQSFDFASGKKELAVVLASIWHLYA